MQKLAEICIRRPVFAAMLILGLVVIGAASYAGLDIDRFPAVDLPTVTVRIFLPGASPEEVETEVSQKIEEAVNTVAGIEELRSISAAGVSFTLITFRLDRDIDAATEDVRDRVASVAGDLPENALLSEISKFNNDVTPALIVAVAGPRSIEELAEIADKVVKPQVERASGVGEVRLAGGLERAINVWLEPDRLEAYQIPVTEVRDALVRQNSSVPGGNLTGPLREMTVRTLGRLTEPRAFDDLVVRTVRGQPIRIRDLGRAEDGTKEQRSVVRLDGVPTVTLEVMRQSGANTVEVIEGAKEALERVRTELPADIELRVVRDQSRYIYAALHEIDLHLILGSILASLVVLAFMRSWRSTVIAAVAIPASVIATFGVMKALDFTLNSVTMLALVLMVGVVIDDAIVVLENVFRFVEEKRMTTFEAARAATAEIGFAVLATTFSLVVIFIPVSFMSSVAGRFLFQFGITAAAAVLISLLVSFTLTPMMSARLLRMTPGEEARSRRGFYARLDSAYQRLLAAAVAHRGLVAVSCLVVMAATVPLYRLVPVEYMPAEVDESEFEMNVNAPEGTSLASMDDAMREVEAELRQVRGVRMVLSTAGTSFLGAVNQGNVFVRLTPHGERTFSLGRLARGLLRLDPLEAFRGNYRQADVMDEVRRRLTKHKDLRCVLRNATRFDIGGGNFEVDFALRGPDLDTLYAYADRLRQNARNMGGFVDIDTSLKLDKPEVRAQVDRARAADLDVRMTDIATALRLLVGGDPRVSRFYDAGVNDDYDVAIRLAEGARNDPATIQRLAVPSGRGGLVRLDSLVRIEESTIASRIERLDRQRQVSVRGGVDRGYALAERLAALQRAVDGMNLPPAYSTSVGGRGRELARTYRELRLGPGALDRLHVHDPGLAVREPDPPADHPSLAAAVDPLRPRLPLGDRQHTEPLLSLGDPGPFRRGQEERHPADRSHEQSQIPGNGAQPGHPPGQPRPPAADPDDHPRTGGRHAAPRPRHRPGRRRAPRHRRGRDRRPDPLAVADPGGNAGLLFDLRRPARRGGDQGRAPAAAAETGTETERGAAAGGVAPGCSKRCQGTG